MEEKKKTNAMAEALRRIAGAGGGGRMQQAAPEPEPEEITLVPVWTSKDAERSARLDIKSTKLLPGTCAPDIRPVVPGKPLSVVEFRFSVAGYDGCSLQILLPVPVDHAAALRFMEKKGTPREGGAPRTESAAEAEAAIAGFIAGSLNQHLAAGYGCYIADAASLMLELQGMISRTAAALAEFMRKAGRQEGDGNGEQ